MEMEQKKRQVILESEHSSISILLSTFHQGRKSLLIDDIEFDESKFRAIIQESFFASLAVESPNQKMYSLYLEYWMMEGGDTTNNNNYYDENGEEVYYDEDDYYDQD